jgi:hypothetical protein
MMTNNRGRAQQQQQQFPTFQNLETHREAMGGVMKGGAATCRSIIFLIFLIGIINHVPTTRNDVPRNFPLSILFK